MIEIKNKVRGMSLKMNIDREPKDYTIPSVNYVHTVNSAWQSLPVPETMRVSRAFVSHNECDDWTFDSLARL